MTFFRDYFQPQYLDAARQNRAGAQGRPGQQVVRSLFDTWKSGAELSPSDYYFRGTQENRETPARPNLAPMTGYDWVSRQFSPTSGQGPSMYGWYQQRNDQPIPSLSWWEASQSPEFSGQPGPHFYQPPSVQDQTGMGLLGGASPYSFMPQLQQPTAFTPTRTVLPITEPRFGNPGNMSPGSMSPQPSYQDNLNDLSDQLRELSWSVYSGRGRKPGFQDDGSFVAGPRPSLIKGLFQ